MADTKFTDGPWEISHQNGDPEQLFKGIIGPAQTNRLGKTYRTYVAQFVEPKNAHSIAAAPKLYEAVEELTAAMRKYEMDVDGDAPASHREMMHKAESALAKARGEA